MSYSFLKDTSQAVYDAGKSKLAGIEEGAEVNNISDANASLLTGGVSTTVPHKHRATGRSSSTSTTIVLSDENNILHITDARTAAVNVSIDASVKAIDWFKFSVIVDYAASYVVYIVISSGSQYWTINGDATSGKPLCYDFVIENGEPVPLGPVPDYLSS